MSSFVTFILKIFFEHFKLNRFYFFFQVSILGLSKPDLSKGLDFAVMFCQFWHEYTKAFFSSMCFPLFGSLCIYYFSLFLLFFFFFFLSVVFVLFWCFVPVFIVSGISFPLWIPHGLDRDGPVMPSSFLLLLLLWQSTLAMLTLPVSSILTLADDLSLGLLIPYLRMKGFKKH